ncbi:Hypothetical protein Minf_1928 [Methylacidiphilum infernorum V4]|uniref:Uncharacterized protein n=1 Tax=Methylacidiphilum infernorum (isolate V4) TaxID=481448 RepID=B3DY30_METI4|nr:Hypothetical protein Minf_1928 [Methylacidiphilum infernorum V4]
MVRGSFSCQGLPFCPFHRRIAYAVHRVGVRFWVKTRYKKGGPVNDFSIPPAKSKILFPLLEYKESSWSKRDRAIKKTAGSSWKFEIKQREQNRLLE